MKILHLIDTLEYHGSARQLCLLASAQGQDAIVCCLGAETPWSAKLRDAGLAVHSLGWTRWFDVCALWNLRGLLREATPDVIHVWRPSALRALAMVAPSCLARAVMSSAMPTMGEAGWIDRWLLGRVGCVAVNGASDRDRAERLGFPVRFVPPAVGNGTADSQRDDDAERGPRIVYVGNLEAEEGARHAVWAFDFLRQVHTTATLRLVGAGSQKANLRALSHGLLNADHVSFLSEQPDLSDVFASADVVWVPSQTNCGRQVALEAMAHGCPVVASDVPCLHEVIRDGETGFLTPARDVVQIARRTHALIRDPQQRRQIGAAARAAVVRDFSLERAVECWNEVYRQIAA